MEHNVSIMSAKFIFKRKTNFLLLIKNSRMYRMETAKKATENLQIIDYFAGRARVRRGKKMLPRGIITRSLEGTVKWETSYRPALYTIWIFFRKKKYFSQIISPIMPNLIIELTRKICIFLNKTLLGSFLWFSFLKRIGKWARAKKQLEDQLFSLIC